MSTVGGALFLFIAIAQASDLFTIAVLPDTQFYSSFYEETFQEQVAWSCQCAKDPRVNVRFVSHLGDIVHRKNRYVHDWNNAGRAVRELMRCGLPHGILPGNHDVDYHSDDPYRCFHDTFPLDDYKRYEGSWFGGSYNNYDMRNTYQLFESDSSKFLFIHLEYLPGLNDSAAIARWASHVLEIHSDRMAFLSTHYAGSDCSDTVQYYVKRLVSEHCNLKFVFGGHVYGCGGERTIPVVNACNKTSYVLVSDFQNRIRGGNGWLRYYTFDEREETMCAYTFSPIEKRFELDDNSHFRVDLTDMTIHTDGCPIIDPPCSSHYASPGFVLASVWIASILILFLYFLMVIFPDISPEDVLTGRDNWFY